MNRGMENLLHKQMSHCSWKQKVRFFLETLKCWHLILFYQQKLQGVGFESRTKEMEVGKKRTRCRKSVNTANHHPLSNILDSSFPFQRSKSFDRYSKIQKKFDLYLHKHTYTLTLTHTYTHKSNLAKRKQFVSFSG